MKPGSREHQEYRRQKNAEYVSTHRDAIRVKHAEYWAKNKHAINLKRATVKAMSPADKIVLEVSMRNPTFGIADVTEYAPQFSGVSYRAAAKRLIANGSLYSLGKQKHGAIIYSRNPPRREEIDRSNPWTSLGRI